MFIAGLAPRINLTRIHVLFLLSKSKESCQDKNKKDFPAKWGCVKLLLLQKSSSSATPQSALSLTAFCVVNHKFKTSTYTAHRECTSGTIVSVSVFSTFATHRERF